MCVIPLLRQGAKSHGIIETESRGDGPRGWGRGHCCLMGTESQLGKMKSSGDGQW